MDKRPLASRLEGKKIGNWFVKEKRIKDKQDNSGLFSSGYIVENDSGQLGFLKAFNYEYGLKQVGFTADALKDLLDSFTYERDLLNFKAQGSQKPRGQAYTFHIK